ncbi:hypothetical protein RINTU1_10480 [Candidatus Regiella insecticola]|uniref:Uncharacterized protein n=1 Tax=Candidatus Regiella insecticola TaxID=138073 RepID=A0A6L2ZMY3_9ENTR|nr:hypothetical protein RINTU1_10480 [Candidatus Regiella insecticola]
MHPFIGVKTFDSRGFNGKRKIIIRQEAEKKGGVPMRI